MSRLSHQLLHITGAAAARDQLGTPSERTGNLPALRGYLSSSSWALKAVTCAYTPNMPAPGSVWVSCGHNRHNRETACEPSCAAKERFRHSFRRARRHGSVMARVSRLDGSHREP